MSFADSIKPISYFKANAAEVLEKLAQSGEPLIITQNGELSWATFGTLSKRRALAPQSGQDAPLPAARIGRSSSKVP
jgi:PHD/YefM family antitoxin component YafN of YafNO toxin-antitoxin module